MSTICRRTWFQQRERCGCCAASRLGHEETTDNHATVRLDESFDMPVELGWIIVRCHDGHEGEKRVKEQEDDQGSDGARWENSRELQGKRRGCFIPLQCRRPRVEKRRARKGTGLDRDRQETMHRAGPHLPSNQDRCASQKMRGVPTDALVRSPKPTNPATSGLRTDRHSHNRVLADPRGTIDVSIQA